MSNEREGEFDETLTESKTTGHGWKLSSRKPRDPDQHPFLLWEWIGRRRREAT